MTINISLQSKSIHKSYLKLHEGVEIKTIPTF